jgi:hypothetical protein
VPSVTLEQMMSRVYSRLDGNTVLYLSQEVINAINEQIRVVNCYTGYLQTVVELPSFTRPNQVWYRVPSGVLFPLRLQWEQTFLDRVSLDMLGQSHPNWSMENTANTGMQVSRWALAGLGIFALHPADSVGGNDIRITAIQEPVLLESGTDVIPFPNEYSEIIEDLTVVALVLKESGQTFQQTLVLYKKAMSKLKEMSRWMVWRQPALRTEYTITR